jgi:four helix bundle protein
MENGSSKLPFSFFMGSAIIVFFMDNSAPRENALKSKSYLFAVQVVKVYKHLAHEFKEYVLSKQLLRAGTSIGANIAEANQAQSRPDFASKLSIALKESVETEYWINLLRDSDYLTASQAESLLIDCIELKKMLVAAIKTTKNGPR